MMNKNAIQILELYRHAGTWVFDDEKNDLVAEPFVAGVPAIIDKALSKTGDEYEKNIRVLFSHSPFPDGIKVEKIKEEMGGCWYRDADEDIGWLCGATLFYFENFPDEIYFKIEVIK
jgi:hypothetical protein